jgi:chromatin segregation and condensation protein Rec8/ScpA/Scc1 (kleisin family)
MEDYDAEMVAEQPWEETLEFLTSDMNPESIDITVLADRYREYIRELQKNNLQVSARAIRVLAALLNMKAQALRLEEEEEEEEENPMDFEEEELIEEEEIVEDDEPDLNVGPDLEMPVKQKPKRRVRLDELKDSLRDAMEVKEKREQREEQRMEMDEQFEVEEEDLQTKLNSLYSRITDFVSSPSENVDFTKLVSDADSQEKIEKFKHVLNLENDEKVDLIQEEFLGNLRVQPKEEEVAN